MPRRHIFTEKSFPFEIKTKEVVIYPEYFVTKPLRGMTEIDALLKLVLKHNSYICGGYARYCVSPAADPSPPGDIDIYSFDEASHEALIEEFQEIFHGSEDHELEYAETRFSESFMFDHRENPELHMISRVQFIKPTVQNVTSGNVQDILRNFDFTIVKAAILDENNVIVHNGLIKDEQEGVLRIPGKIRNPLSTFSRIIKYSKKGYKTSPHTMISLLNAWKTIDNQEKLDAMLQMMSVIEETQDSAMWDSEILGFEQNEITKQIDTLKHEVGQSMPWFDPRPKPSNETLEDIYSKKREGQTHTLVLDAHTQRVLRGKSLLPDYPY